MTQICDAVFENGVFRPIATSRASFTEGQHVRLVVETNTPDDILRLAAQVYDGLTEKEVNDIERVAFDRTAFFTRTES